jgi:hypothetical protein
MLCKYRLTEDGQIFTDEAFRELLRVFFKGDHTIMEAEPNDDMMDALWQAIWASRQASKAFGFVSRPVRQKTVRSCDNYTVQ